MSTGLSTKGEIQDFLQSVDTNSNLNLNLNSVLSRLGITGVNTSNSNNRDTIIAALRKFKNLKIGGRRRADFIDPRSIINYEKKRTNYTSRARKVQPGSIRYPWILLEFNSSGEPIVRSVFVPGYSSAKGWEIDWVGNVPLEAFPLSRIQEVFNSAITSNNKVRSQTVGKVCKLGYPPLQSRCGTPGGSSGSWSGRNIRNRFAYIYDPSAQSYNTYKNGISGLSVDQLAKIIIRIGKTNSTNRAKARADFLELKRNGDYGEVFTIFELNSNLGRFIMKPGDISLAQIIINNGGNIPPEFDNFVSANFYYTKGCFWSTDRPALFLCILLNIPFVRTIGRTYYFNLGKPFNDLLTLLNGRFLKDAIRYEAGEDTGITKENYEAACDILDAIITNRVKQPDFNSMWFIKMCVIDTAHDFGNDSARAKMAASRQQRIMMKDIMIGMGIRRGANNPSGSWKSFVDSVWSAKDVEFVMGKIINSISQQTSSADQVRYQSSNTRNRLNILSILDSKDMCIIWDSGSSPPGELINRTALAAAKFLDPAA